MNPWVLLIVATMVIWLLAGLIWLFLADGIDRLKHPEEWTNKGKAGERALFLALTKKYKVPSEQIFRNVYIPTKDGTTEIDLLVVSRKGLLVFEMKNYSGNIYGDGERRKWIQYIGSQKNYFLNPVLQNKWHIRSLGERYKDLVDLPIIPFVSVTGNAKWNIKNLSPEDHVLLANGSFGKIYNNLPDADAMKKNYKMIIEDLRKLERPDDDVREQHVQKISNRYKK